MTEAELDERRGGTRAYPPIGDRLRRERQARGLSLRELADRLDLSASLISQVETGRARPSVRTLYALADALDVSLDELLELGGRPEAAGGAGAGAAAGGGAANGSAGDDAGAATTAGGATADSPAGKRPPGAHPADRPGGPVQRADSRLRIRLASGVVWERLTPASEDGAEFLHVTYEVGGSSSPADAYQRHGGHEWGFVLQGRLRVSVGFDDYDLGPGDSVSFASTTPHRLANAGDEPVHAIWFVLGRHGREPETT